MKRLAIIVIVGCVTLMSADSMALESNCVNLVCTEKLGARLREAWTGSLAEFTNVAQRMSCNIFSISNSESRLQYARAYAEAILSLPKHTYDCNFAGLTARMIACRYLTNRLPDDMPLSLEFKWEIIARWWLQMKDEIVHFEAFGPRLPTLMYSGIMFSEEAQRKAIEEVETENKKRTQFDRQHEHAKEIRGFMNGQYRFTYERQLMMDCANLNNQRKDALLKMVIDAIGRVPEWYSEDLAERGLRFDLQSMSRITLDPNSIVGASGRAIKTRKDTNGDDIKVDMDL